MTEQVFASPTKRFFVQMLTRDIELKDAVLDLLDNCVDGVLRQLGPAAGGATPYDGYRAEITATPEQFRILDNCGGIPVPIATQYAFMFGNPDLDRDAEFRTVGMYGIGMKRAIFKMGGETVVRSQPESGPYEVAIPPEWLDADDNWNLVLRETDEDLAENGTEITTTRLWPSIAQQFDPDSSAFLIELRREIARLYAVIIQKGFRVILNGAEVEAAPIKILGPIPDDWTEGPALAPYVFTTSISGVDVRLVVGFYRSLATEQVIEEESESPRETSHKAGWTVICNDRVVLYGDRSLVTGWGRATVPRFHNQFLAIAGVVEFESTDSLSLPLNTTKRGLDTSSDVYLTILDYMQEGTKVFTSFTNRWKSREEEVAPAFEAASQRSPREIAADVPEAEWTAVAKLREQGHQARRYSPHLPNPPDAEMTRRIVFTRPIDRIRRVALHLFDDADVPPREVGERAFDEIHGRVEAADA